MQALVKLRKQQEEAQTKQTDDFTTDSIVKLTKPIEKLAKGGILHEAASVDNELEQSSLSIGEVADVTKVATVDDNTIEENEIPLLNVITNEVNIVSNDVSQNAGCITKTTESGENLKENESLGVVCVDTKETESTSLLVPGVCASKHSKETELLTGAPEEIATLDDLLSFYTMSPEEMWEQYHDLINDSIDTLAQLISNEDVEEIAPNSAENTVCSFAETTTESKETQAVSTITGSPATKNQAHFSCPLPCNPECTAIKESIENLMARVGEIESTMHTFKEDLQKTVDKLNANSF